MKTELENMDILRLSNTEANKVTKECLQIALMKLMAEKPFEKISITEITQCAGVSRPAFYRNYSSKEAIIEDALQSMFSDIRHSLVKYHDRLDWKGWYVLFFQAITENQKNFKIALDAHVPISSMLFLDSAFPPSSNFEHYVNCAKEAAFVRILTDWFENGMKESPEEMGEICDRIIKWMGSGKS